MDTIFAEATAQGRAGVSVVRVSGPQALVSLAQLTESDAKARVAHLRTLKDAAGQVLDTCLVLFFEGPASFTGEDVVEYHVHGSVAVVSAVQSVLAACDGHRRAEPGEFTRRALAKGKMDLTQVEGLADLIEAQTEYQRKQAQATVSGVFSQFVEETRADLIRAAALLEASMDFADEEVPEDVSPEVIDLLEAVQRRLREQISGHQFAERLRSGFEVAIIGAPNVGKSTLLNALAGRDAAITSKHAGTTRDVIEVHMDLQGIPVTVLDTAGLRETDDEVEGIGIQRAKERAEAADLRVFLTEGADPSGLQLRADDITVRAKADLSKSEMLSVSGLTGQGVEDLVSRIRTVLEGRVAQASLATRERHVEDLSRAANVVDTALEHVRIGASHFDVAAEDLRTARHALAKTLGRVDVENLLDVIFSSFCLGK